VTHAARALFAGLVDYAGLFPPAALPMTEATARYASFRAGPHAWMLGGFVLPASSLEGFARAASAYLRSGDDAMPWRLNVPCGAPLDRDLSMVDAFESRHTDVRSGEGSTVKVEALEVKAANAVAVHDAATSIAGRHWTWFEIASGPALGSTLEAIASVGGGAKLRTGGVTAEAFPSSADIATVLLVCAKAAVPFKATAGLHHPFPGVYPLTYETDSPRAPMHGFVNVFLARALATELVRRQHPDPEAVAEIIALLDDRPDAFLWEDDGVRWRAHRFTTDDIIQLRRLAAGFGSCSFEEPVADLSRLGLIEMHGLRAQ
jgi:hypothetical protein